MDHPPPIDAPRGSLLPGRVLDGKYEIIGAIGEGGMGRVYSARHLFLGHTVALKIATTPEAVDRFVEEARATAQMESEHVVKVTDVGVADGAPYMAMDFLDGADLGRMVADRGPLAWDRAIGYVLQACEALAEAHAAGIIHRDLKPDNLFLAIRKIGPPVIKVLDFGIAKSIENARANPTTAPQVILGTAHYMSPEQIRTPRDVDRRTDVWSMGVVLFELLTGAPPFRGETTASVIGAVLTDDLPDVQTLCPDVPKELDAVIRRCLQKDRDARYQTITELSVALAPFAPEAACESLPRIQTGLATPRLAASDTGAATSRSVSSNPRPQPRGRVAWLAGVMFAAGVAIAVARTSTSTGSPRAASARVDAAAPTQVADVSSAPTATTATAPVVTAKASAVRPDVGAVKPRAVATTTTATPRPSARPSATPMFGNFAVNVPAPKSKR